MNVLGRWWSDREVDVVYRRLDGGNFGRTTKDRIRAVLHAAEAVPVADLQAAHVVLRALADMKLTATGKDFDPLVLAARELLPDTPLPSPRNQDTKEDR